jgi:hypothetical protein
MILGRDLMVAPHFYSGLGNDANLNASTASPVETEPGILHPMRTPQSDPRVAQYGATEHGVSL